jgi:hypothetical protein
MKPNQAPGRELGRRDDLSYWREWQSHALAQNASPVMANVAGMGGEL